MAVKVTTPRGDTVTYDTGRKIDVNKEGVLFVLPSTGGYLAAFTPEAWSRADTVDPTVVKRNSRAMTVD